MGGGNRSSALEALAVWARRSLAINSTGRPVGGDGREFVRIAKNHCEGMIAKILRDLGETNEPEHSGSGRQYGGKSHRKILDILKDDIELVKHWGDDPYNVEPTDTLPNRPLSGEK